MPNILTKIEKAAQALYDHPIKASRDPVIDEAVNALDEAAEFIMDVILKLRQAKRRGG